jgi:hypothetical protein
MGLGGLTGDGDAPPLEGRSDRGFYSTRGPKGDTGDTGPEGPTGAHGAVWQGLWAYDHTYIPNDVVNYGGAAWISKTTNIFKPCPSNPDDWDLFVDKGQPGVDGEDGADGTNGTNGTNGDDGESVTVTLVPSSSWPPASDSNPLHLYVKVP